MDLERHLQEVAAVNVHVVHVDVQVVHVHVNVQVVRAHVNVCV